MTPKEWVLKELKEMGLSKSEASKMMGYSTNWLNDMLKRKGFTEHRALALVVDLRRIIQKKAPIDAYKKEIYMERVRKARRAARLRRAEMEEYTGGWYE